MQLADHPCSSYVLSGSKLLNQLRLTRDKPTMFPDWMVEKIVGAVDEMVDVADKKEMVAKRSAEQEITP